MSAAGRVTMAAKMLSTVTATTTAPNCDATQSLGAKRALSALTKIVRVQNSKKALLPAVDRAELKVAPPTCSTATRARA